MVEIEEVGTTILTVILAGGVVLESAFTAAPVLPITY